MGPTVRPRRVARLLAAVGVTLLVGGIASLALVVERLTLIAYAGAVIFESIAGGVLTRAPAERRRERTIEHLHDHFIICGYGRVGQRVALIGVGSPDELRRLEALCGSRESVAG